MNFGALLDFGLGVPIFGLMGISLAVIGGSDLSLFFPQLTFFIVGIIFFLIFSAVDYRLWQKFSGIFYIVSLLLLLATFLNPEVRGASRWIDIGFFRLQPSELIKPFATVFFVVILLERKKSTFWAFLKPFLFSLPLLFLIFRQPDLGNFLVYLFIFISVEIIGGLPLLYLLTSTTVFIVGFPLIWHFLKQYQKSRLLTFINPYIDPAGAGYNAIQAIIAIGSGSIMGLGLGRGTQSHLLFLPEYHTDFIFASIGEELGFIGGLFVIVFYFIILTRILQIVLRTEDDFGRFLAIGIFAQIFIQVFINIGMNLGVVPITGITLPLLSYGGSSIVSILISLGMVGSIAKITRRKSAIVIK